VQFAPGPWSYAEDDFALNIQFWMHIFGGAKSIKYFVAQSHTRTDYPNLWQEAQRLLKQFSPVEHLIGFSEPSGLVKSNTIKCVARALVSDQFMLVGAMNNTVTYTWNGDLANIKYNPNIQSTAYQLDITVPEWILSPAAWMILPDGRRKNINLQSLGSNKYRIVSPENLYKQSHVFLIGPADSELPVSPSKLQAVDVVDNKNYTLSWNFGSDNMGVAGYVLSVNNQLVDTVYGQVYEVDSLQLNCQTANWELRSFDLFRNGSANRTILSLPYDASIQSVRIDSISANNIYSIGDTVFLLAIVSGNAVVQKWESSSDSLNWSAVTADGNTLYILNDSIAFRSTIPGTKYFRKMIRDGCGNTIYSGTIKVETSPLTGNDPDFNLAALVYPNPARNKFVVQLTNLEKVTRLEVFNEQNQKMVSIKDPDNSTSVDLSSYAAGIYYVVVSAKDKQYTTKLLVIK
jgi:hypothetical protein